MTDVELTARERSVVVFCAVRRAALLLGTETVSERDYRRALTILRAAGGQERLPHPRRLKRLVGGGWEQVLRVALLPMPDTPIPAAKPAAQALPGMAVVEAIAWFWQVNRQFPSRTTLERFMHACDARLANAQTGVAWHRYLDEARVLLAQQGYAPDDGQPQHGRRVSFAVPPGARIPGAAPQRHNRRGAVTRDRCLEALRRFTAEQRRAGQPLSRAHYLRWRRGTRWPAPSSMSSFGGFTKLREQADA